MMIGSVLCQVEYEMQGVSAHLWVASHEGGGLELFAEDKN